MPTQRVEIAPKHIESAKEAAAARTYESGDPLVFADVVEKGLQLRVRASTASWILKFNGSSKSIGKLTEVRTAKAARERAQNVRAILRRGEDAGEYLKSLAVSKDHDAAAADTASRKARANGAWTWKALAAAYEAEYLAVEKVTKGGTKPPSENTIKDFRRYTSLPHHKEHLDDLLVRDIKPETIELVRNLTRESNGPNAGRKVVQWISAAMTWGQENHRLHTGLGMQNPWWKVIKPGHKPKARTRFLNLQQIAQVLYVAERHRNRGDRMQKKETTEAAISALWWIVLTAQRTTASMLLRNERIIDDKDCPGWKIATFPAEDMKSRRYHALPLPPRTALLLERAKMGIDRKSAWAFPSKKVRRAQSVAIEDLHIHDTTVNLLIRRLRGQDTVGKKRESIDLLKGIPHFSPHDLRRSLATILADMSIAGGAASAVLDHSSKTPHDEEFREADITRLAYNQSQKISLKRTAMEAWTNAVFAAVEAEWKTNDRSRSYIVPPPEIERFHAGHVVPFSPKKPWYLMMEDLTAKREREAAARVARFPGSLKKLGSTNTDHEWGLDE